MERPLLARKVDDRGLGRSKKPAVVVHRHSRHVRHRFGAADPGPVIRRALLDIWAVKSSILERRSLRIRRGVCLVVT